MTAARPKYARQIDAERSIAPFIPYSNHVSPTTLVTKAGDYLRIWKVEGITHETTDADDLQVRLDQLNTILRGIATSNIAVWTHNVRRKVSDRLESSFDDTFSRELDSKYYARLSGHRMMANELYLTIVYRPVVGRAERGAIRAARRSIEVIRDDQRQAIQHLDEIALQVNAGLRRYGLEALGVYTDPRGVECSRALEFLNFLVSGEFQKVRLPRGPIDSYLGNAYLFMGTDTVEIRGPTSRRFAQGVDFKDYPEYSEAGMLNELMHSTCEYVITQSFSFKGRAEAVKALKTQQNQLRASEDGSLTQIVEMEHAIDALTQGQFAMGEYHFSLFVHADAIPQLQKDVAGVMAVLKDCGFLASKITTATDAAFYAQLPANWEYRPRIATLTSRNFAGLASLHNYASGKRDNNPWGQAVTLLQTPSGQPLYFNFHASKEDEDSFDKKLLGNTRIIGMSGSGKTALMNFLLSQAQKFGKRAPDGFTTVYFDKDRGAELTIRATGGKYLPLANGVPTGFNPFQMEPTEANIDFLERWTAELCRSSDAGESKDRLSATDIQRISHAVRTVMRMPRELRSITTVTHNIPEGITREERENSLVKRLEKWCRGQPLGWVADCPEDVLDFDSHTNYGFDGTAFLDNPVIRTPLSSYLLYRMEQAIDGRRLIYFMDEAWKWVDDDAFADFADNKQLTIRKQNGLGVFATQMPSSLLKSKCGASLVQQCATEIYLPNPKADRSEYMDGFKLSEAEFDIVRSLAEDSRMFLVKQGHRSAVARLDLGGLDDELAILSGTTDNIELLDRVIEEHGDDPDVWLPIFHSRRKARVAGSRGKT